MTSNQAIIGTGRVDRVAASVPGHKHSCVPLIAGALLAGQVVRLRNVPRIADTRLLADILADGGACVRFVGRELEIDARAYMADHPCPRRTSLIHGALYLLPAVLGKLGRVRLGATGGCNIGAGSGARPVEHMVAVLRRFGAEFDDSGAGLRGIWQVRRGATIDLMEFSDDPHLLTGPLVSGATKTALLAALAVPGASTLRHLYPKPDVLELVDFMRGAGFALEGNTEHLEITPGTPSATIIEKTVVSDLSEIMTAITAGVCFRAPVRLEVEVPELVWSGLAPERAVLAEMGVSVARSGKLLEIDPPDRLRAADIEVTSTGIYSDHQPFFCLMLLGADRPSRIRERVWKHRFGYARELAKLGARINIEANEIRIHPSCLRPSSQLLVARDLRAAAVLCLAAALVPGDIAVEGVDHLERGYEDFVGWLRSVGVPVTLRSEEHAA